jgi:hypothetical protein
VPLHLVGETIDKSRSHYLAGTGKLVQFMRGIYVDADRTVLAQAARLRATGESALAKTLKICRHRIDSFA